MREPHLGEFKRLILGGAASQDVHDGDGRRGYAVSTGMVDGPYLQREVERVATHAKALVPLLERHVGKPRRVLDFGCGTGGTTVAMALSKLDAQELVGVDANERALTAARVRASGHDQPPPRLRFEAVTPGRRLPFADGSFDLVTAVSVVEFITCPGARGDVVSELRRVVAPGGFLYIATPRPRVREYHSRRWLGDLRRATGMPWSSPPWELREWARGWHRVDLTADLAKRAAARVPAPVAHALAPLLPLATSWQRLLVRRPA